MTNDMKPVEQVAQPPAEQSGMKLVRFDWTMADGTKPGLQCSWCHNMVPVTEYGLCGECCDDLALTRTPSAEVEKLVEAATEAREMLSGMYPGFIGGSQPYNEAERNKEALLAKIDTALRSYRQGGGES